MSEMVGDTSKKWGIWSLKRTFWIGLGVAIVAAVLRALTWSFAGLESIAFDVIDTAGLIAVIVVATKREGGALAKSIAFILIFLIGYTMGILIWFGGLFFLGAASGTAG